MLTVLFALGIIAILVAVVAGLFEGTNKTKGRRKYFQLSLEALEPRYAPANIVWNGPADGNWSAGGNWVGGVAPTASDVAVFNNTVNTNSQVDAPFTIAGLEIAAGYTSTITMNQAVTIRFVPGAAASAQRSGTITGTGTLTIDTGTTFYWSGGTMAKPAG